MSLIFVLCTYGSGTVSFSGQRLITSKWKHILLTFPQCGRCSERGMPATCEYRRRSSQNVDTWGERWAIWLKVRIRDFGSTGPYSALRRCVPVKMKNAVILRRALLPLWPLSSLLPSASAASLHSSETPVSFLYICCSPPSGMLFPRYPHVPHLGGSLFLGHLLS